MRGLVDDYGLRVIVSTHPRTRARIAEEDAALPALVELCKPMCFTDYIKLQTTAFAVLSDSGTITEESSILNIPALNLREAHERPEGMEEAAVMMTGLDWERIRQCLSVLDRQRGSPRRLFRVVDDYDVSNVSEKVLRIILSYTDYIQRMVWHRYPPLLN